MRSARRIRTKLVDIVQRRVQYLLVELFRVHNRQDDRVELAERANLAISPCTRPSVPLPSIAVIEQALLRRSEVESGLTLLGVRLVNVTLTFGLTVFLLPPDMLTEVCSP
jgi:hypothetical protein